MSDNWRGNFRSRIRSIRGWYIVEFLFFLIAGITLGYLFPQWITGMFSYLSDISGFPPLFEGGVTILKLVVLLSGISAILTLLVNIRYILGRVDSGEQSSEELGDDRDPTNEPIYFSGEDADELSKKLYNLVDNNPRYALEYLKSELDCAAYLAVVNDVSENGIHEEELPDLLSVLDTTDEKIAEQYRETISIYEAAISQNSADLEDAMDVVRLGVALIKKLDQHRPLIPFESGNTYWMGTRLVIEKSTDNAGTVLNLRKVVRRDNEKQIGTLVKQFRTDERHYLDTSALGTGSYVLVDQEQNPVRLQSDGSISEAHNVTSPRIEIVEQTLSVDTERGIALNAGETTRDTMNIKSNRASFVLWVACKNLDIGEMKNIFQDHPTYLGSFAQKSANYISFDVGPRGSIIADFSGIVPGEYEFYFVVPDTQVSTLASVRVRPRV